MTIDFYLGAFVSDLDVIASSGSRIGDSDEIRDLVRVFPFLSYNRYFCIRFCLIVVTN